MTGTDLINALVSDLCDSRDHLNDFVNKNKPDKKSAEELITKIRKDLDLYYEYADDLDTATDNITIDVN